MKRKLIILAMFILLMLAAIPTAMAAGCTHPSTTKVTIKAATCGASGVSGYKCTNCGQVLSSGPVPATGNHSWKAATCKAPKTCKTCGTTQGSKLVHKPTEMERTPATATKHGEIVKVCPNCGGTERVVIHNYAAATCTKPATCKICKATSGTKKGHNWKAATCKAPKTCKTCGITQGSKLVHKPTEMERTPATATKHGEIVKVCPNCGGTEREVIHNYSPATCTVAATCKICKTTSGSKLGHTWKAATCKAPKTCSRCGQTDGSKLMHNPVERERTPATETQHGEVVYVCDNCGGTESEVIHNYTFATCEKPSTCKICGATDGGSLRHNWAEATCTLPRRCTRPGCKLTEGNPHGHSPEGDTHGKVTCDWCGETYCRHYFCGQITQPTCEVDGEEYSACSYCGVRDESEEVRIIKAPGHEFVYPVVDGDKFIKVCEVCHKEELIRYMTPSEWDRYNGYKEYEKYTFAFIVGSGCNEISAETAMAMVEIARSSESTRECDQRIREELGYEAGDIIYCVYYSEMMGYGIF